MKVDKKGIEKRTLFYLIMICIIALALFAIWLTKIIPNLFPTA